MKCYPLYSDTISLDSQASRAKLQVASASLNFEGTLYPIADSKDTNTESYAW